MAGFRRWQTFRAMDASGALLVVVDWDSLDGLWQAAAQLQADGLWSEARGWGFTVLPLEVLPASFERQWRSEARVATLLRLSTGQVPEPPSRDGEFALGAMAAPGSTHLHGARSENGQTSLCRIDFDDEDGIWHFLESPLRRAWSEKSGDASRDEVWAINLPRIEFQQASVETMDPLYILPVQDALSVELCVSDDGLTARLRFQGTFDHHGCARSATLYDALLKDGYRVLEVDVSGLTTIPTEALTVLTRTARFLKEQGGRFVVIDNADRVRKVTRTKHLEASIR